MYVLFCQGKQRWRLRQRSCCVSLQVAPPTPLFCMSSHLAFMACPLGPIYILDVHHPGCARTLTSRRHLPEGGKGHASDCAVCMEEKTGVFCCPGSYPNLPSTPEPNPSKGMGWAYNITSIRRNTNTSSTLIYQKPQANPKPETLSMTLVMSKSICSIAHI